MPIEKKKTTRSIDEEGAATAISPGGLAVMRFLQQKGKATEMELQKEFMKTPKSGGQPYAPTSFYAYMSKLRNAGYIVQNAHSGMVILGPKVADKIKAAS